MLQAFLQKIELFNRDLVPTVQGHTVYSEVVLKAISDSNIEVNKCCFCKEVQYRGTCYTLKQVLALGKDEFDLSLGKVASIFIVNGNVHFIVKSCKGNFVPCMGVYVLNYGEDNFKCVHVNALHDYYLFIHSQ